jgi:hypothetical protein
MISLPIGTEIDVGTCCGHFCALVEILRFQLKNIPESVFNLLNISPIY